MSYEFTTPAPTISDAPLQDEVILAEQFFTAPRGPAAAERCLLAAILEDAINCYQTLQFATGGRSRRLCREAEQWIMGSRRRGGRDAPYPYFSFEQICDVLGLDADCIRARLLCWRQRDAPAPQAARGRLSRANAAGASE